MKCAGVCGPIPNSKLGVLFFVVSKKGFGILLSIVHERATNYKMNLRVCGAATFSIQGKHMQFVPGRVGEFTCSGMGKQRPIVVPESCPNRAP